MSDLNVEKVRAIRSVYVAEKPGTSRRFASAEPYSPEFAATLHRDGYTITRVLYYLPPGWDSADLQAFGVPGTKG